jgi:hypothetical protein
VESLSSPSFNLRGTGLCVLGYRGSKTDKVNSVDWPDARVLPLSTREVCDNVVARESAVDTISSAVDEPDRTRSSEPDVSDISRSIGAFATPESMQESATPSLRVRWLTSSSDLNFSFWFSVVCVGLRDCSLSLPTLDVSSIVASTRCAKMTGFGLNSKSKGLTPTVELYVAAKLLA